MLPRACRSVAALSMMMGLAAASHASDWGTVPAISSTMGVHDGRVCVGEATRGDIGCPTYAPEVGTDGAISATRFVGDGSGLTGVVASTADRIVSGSTSLLAVSGTGFVSLTQAGTNTGWFDPARGLVTLGVSATGQISASGLYSSNPLRITVYNDLGNQLQLMNYSDASYWNILKRSGAYTPEPDNLGFFFWNGSYWTNPMNLTSNSRVGIGTTAPTTRLEVSGTISATRFIGDGSGLTGVVASTADRIVSGSTSLLAVSSTGFVSLTQAGTNTGWFDPTRGLVTLGVSTTGVVSATRGYFGGLTVRAANQGSGIETITATTISNLTSNINQLNVLFRRHTAGSDWMGTNMRLQRQVDNTPMGFIDFGIDGTANWGLGFGSGGSTSMVLRYNGWVGIGTINPGTPLEVSGTALIKNTGSSSTLYLASNDGEEGTPGIFIYDPTTGGSSFGGRVYYDDSAGQNHLKIAAVDSNVDKSFISLARTTNFVGVGINTPTTHLEVSGTVSATRFVGDGSGLTNLQGASADRIVSGTTSLLAVSSTGFVSLTQAGTNTGWFDPTRGLVTLGVSSTGTISGTNGYFNGNVGIGTAPVSNEKLSVLGSIRATGRVTANANASQASPAFTFSDATNAGMYLNNNTLRFVTNGLDRMTLTLGGNVGIGTVTPTTPLEVSGTVSATYVKLADNDDVPCTPERKGTLRFSNGIVSICRAQ